MIKRIIAGLCFVCTTAAFAQQNNSSPYSFYGIGDTKFKGTAENRSMGSLGVLTDSIHANLQNPATYGQLKFSTFTVGATTTKTQLQTQSESSNAGRTSVDYIALALPFKKFGVAFGLMPYTSVGYRIQNTTAAYPDGYSRLRQFEGTGGLNRVFAGVGYNITKEFSLGAEFNYYFGKIDTRSTVRIADALVPLQYYTREMNSSNYGGLAFNFGAYYNTLINKKYTWTASAVFSPETSLNGSTDREVATIQLSSGGSELVADSYKYSVQGNNDNKMPMKVALGTGFGQARSWSVGAEYTYTNSSVLGNRFDNITNVTFEKANRFAVGGYYIPKYYSFTSYLSRITYRAGLRYENTGMVISGQSIKDKGISLGLGLPLAGIGGTNLNIGAEYGQRGTKAAGLIQENYFNVFIGLSLCDKWFIKRRFE
ncbi:MAG: hypothetical protein ACLGH8_05110 [Bacteroidia bacterium]|jgi:hypothetical protein